MNMREIKSQKLHARRVRVIRRYIILSVLLLFLCLSVVIYNTIIVEATGKQQTTCDDMYKYFTEIRVRRDDTLWGIAQKYMGLGYDSLEDYMDEIREINSISFDRIYYGQRLVIPYYSYESK